MRMRSTLQFLKPAAWLGRRVPFWRILLGGLGTLLGLQAVIIAVLLANSSRRQRRSPVPGIPLPGAAGGAGRGKPAEDLQLWS